MSNCRETTANESLARQERWLVDALIFPERVDNEQVQRQLLASPNMQARECLAVVQRSYILRLTKCLAEQFPALCHALGEPLFRQFADEFLRTHPSSSYTLADLGRRFSGYLNRARPDRSLSEEQREGWIDFMVDLARYERLHFRLFDAPGHEGGSWPNVETPDTQLVLQPCFALDAYRYPVAWYYHAIRQRAQVPFPAEQTCHVAVLRNDYQVTTFPITRVHYLFLAQLAKCDDVDSSLTAVAELVERPLEEVRSSWQEQVRAQWISAGFFVDRSTR